MPPQAVRQGGPQEARTPSGRVPALDGSGCKRLAMLWRDMRTSRSATPPLPAAIGFLSLRPPEYLPCDLWVDMVGSRAQRGATLCIASLLQALCACSALYAPLQCLCHPTPLGNRCAPPWCI